MEFDNVGILDTAIRAVIAIVLLSVSAQAFFPLLVNGLLVAGGVVMVFTSASGWCPIYKLLKIDTFHKKHS
jgi:hypothetical protein